ncbi:MAG: transporter substrate-binding domain-containing protein [Candidatus Choladocola sp.]|nr:transporter substrate-binding domain-containing protein [Candidatus Choladocola sp.]
MKKNFWKKTTAALMTAAMAGTMIGSMAVHAEEERVIKVGMMASVYPYCFIDDDDNLAGYDIDMLAALDEYMDGYTFECEDLQYAVLFESLDTGAVDMLTGSINRTAEREEKYMTPTVDSGSNVCSFVVAEDNTDINGMDDMGGKTMAFDSTRAEYEDLAAWNEAHPDNPIDIEDMSDPTQADMMKMVADGRKDAALIYRDSFDTIQAELNLPVKMLDEYSVKKPFTQLINSDMEGAEEFRDAMDEALQALIDDGTLPELSEKWVGFNMFEE